MEIESASQHKSKLLALAWGKSKDLLEKFKANVIQVAKRTKKLGEDDPRRIIHSLKVGLALTLVSLFYYLRPLYDGFGVSGMWAVLTVVVVFEFTVGATLSKGLNRSFATLLAGALGVGAQHLANLFGKRGEPFVMEILVFLLAAASTFSRFFPRIKARYDYGVLIFILTFSLVSVSGYRVEEILELAHQRLSTILIGGATCLLISIFICPVWAGENLHNSVASNIEKLASYLEGFGEEYFNCSEHGGSVEVSKEEKAFLRGYKSVLNSATTEESLANFARWEPRHGRFGFRYPWKQYLKIGALARLCAYQIEALNGYIHSDIQVPVHFRRRIGESCKKMSSESGKGMKLLASSIKAMRDPSSADPHLNEAKNAVNDLKIALVASQTTDEDLMAIVPAATVASILVEIVKCAKNISEAVHELSRLANFKNNMEAIPSPDKSQLLHKGTINPVLDDDINHIAIEIGEQNNLDRPAENTNAQAPKPGQNG